MVLIEVIAILISFFLLMLYNKQREDNECKIIMKMHTKRGKNKLRIYESSRGKISSRRDYLEL